MCHPSPPIGHVRIIRCCHATNYVTLGPVTLHLTDAELVLLDRTIHKLARREPELQRALLSGLCANNAPDGGDADAGLDVGADAGEVEP